MYTLFSINTLVKPKFTDKIKAFLKIPNISFRHLYDDSRSFIVAELNLPPEIDKKGKSRLIFAAMRKLFKAGVRTVLLPKDFDEHMAIDAGLKPYHADNSLFFNFAPEIIEIAFDKVKAGKNDIWCVFLSERLGKTFERSVLSCVKTARYISIDCGEFSDIFRGVLLKEYGISSPGDNKGNCKKVLALFGAADKNKIWKEAPDLIINFSGERLSYDAAEVISNAEFSVPAQYTENLPEDIDAPGFVSLLVESGYLDIAKLGISRIF